jgi:hypothetical protein
MSLSPDLKERVFGSLSNVPAPTRAEVLRAQAWMCGWGVAGGFVIFLLAGGVRWNERLPALMAITSLGTAGIGGGGMWLLFTRGRSVIGRSLPCLLATAVLSSVLVVGWRYGVSALYGRIEPWPDRPGLRCLGLGVAIGVLPLLAALHAWRRTVPVSPVATGAAFGAGAGLGSALLVDVWCPVSFLPHLLLGHLLPIGLLALLGGTVGSRLLRIR